MSFTMSDEGAFDFGGGTDDLDALLANAADGSEESEDSSRYFEQSPEPVEEVQPQPEPQRFQRHEAPVVREEPTHERFTSPQYSYEPVEDVVEEPVLEPEPVVPEPEPYVPEPVYTPAPEPVEFHEPVQEYRNDDVPAVPVNDSIGHIASIIRVVDAYRSLPADKKEVASKFILGNRIAQDEAEFVSAVLGVDPMLSLTMSTLTEASGMEPVERAFFVIDLDEALMYSVGDLMPAFGKDSIEQNQPKSQYARKLVRIIESLDPAAMEHVAATAKVLKAATD